MEWLAKLLGTIIGSALNQLGPKAIEAIVRGISDAMVQKQVVSKPNADLDAEWADGMQKRDGSGPEKR